MHWLERHIRGIKTQDRHKCVEVCQLDAIGVSDIKDTSEYQDILT